MGSTARLFRPKDKERKCQLSLGARLRAQCYSHGWCVQSQVLSASNRFSLPQWRYRKKSASTAMGTPRDQALPLVAVPWCAHGVLMRTSSLPLRSGLNKTAINPTTTPHVARSHQGSPRRARSAAELAQQRETAVYYATRIGPGKRPPTMCFPGKGLTQGRQIPACAVVLGAPWVRPVPHDVAIASCTLRVLL